jgi:hypothetical protein
VLKGVDPGSRVIEPKIFDVCIACWKLGKRKRIEIGTGIKGVGYGFWQLSASIRGTG